MRWLLRSPICLFLLLSLFLRKGTYADDIDNNNVAAVSNEDLEDEGGENEEYYEDYYEDDYEYEDDDLASGSGDNPGADYAYAYNYEVRENLL